MSNILVCSICGSSRGAVTVSYSDQVTMTRVDSLDGEIKLCIVNGATSREFCDGCKRALRDALSSAVFQLKRTTAVPHV